MANGGDTPEHPKAGTAGLVLGALGVVYGDIGTSPLYTIREAFGLAGGLTPDEASVLGVLSLVFWALVLIVSIKYVLLILRADNRGEGGVLSLGSLAMRAVSRTSRRGRSIFALSVIGLALFFGDGLITPAISVLSAVEGLNAATHVFEPYVLPIAVCILLALFMIQSHGTGRVGIFFGPVMCVWFSTLAVLGILQIVETPRVLVAIDPRFAYALFVDAGWKAFLALGAIVLAITGAEALYADMGHFGRRPIRLAWFGLVLPALLLNYFGQGALVLRDPSAAEHVFFLMAPTWALYPMVALATVATIIASQAVISGVFSLSRQAIQLGYLPRMAIRHTSEHTEGQIYIPRINWALMTGVIILVVGFGSSSNLAAAYGISVVGAMSIDAVLAGIVAIGIWKWRPWAAIAVFGAFLIIDFAFLAANAHKIPAGGWFPLAVAAITMLTISTWRRGRELLGQALYADALPLSMFLDRMESTITRVPGTAVYMTAEQTTVPHALLHNLKHNRVLHQRVVLMTVHTEDVPRVPEKQRVEVERLGKGFFGVSATYGFMDEPNVPEVLEQCRAHGLAFDMMETSFFLGRETLVPMSRELRARTKQALPPWQERVFIAMSATSQSATAFFGIPPNRVVEMGTQIEI